MSENRRYQEVMLQYRCALKALESRLENKKHLPINAEVDTGLKECADSSREWDGKMEHLLHIIT